MNMPPTGSITAGASMPIAAAAWAKAASNWGFNGAKGSVYEGGIRVAMIMRWTNGLPSGHHEVTNLIHFTDWLPTLAAAAGIDMQGDLPLDRNNVLPQILGEQP